MSNYSPCCIHLIAASRAKDLSNVFLTPHSTVTMSTIFWCSAIIRLYRPLEKSMNKQEKSQFMSFEDNYLWIARPGTDLLLEMVNKMDVLCSPKTTTARIAKVYKLGFVKYETIQGDFTKHFEWLVWFVEQFYWLESCCLKRLQL